MTVGVTGRDKRTNRTGQNRYPHGLKDDGGPIKAGWCGVRQRVSTERRADQERDFTFKFEVVSIFEI